jgi:hypothetical protein
MAVCDGPPGHHCLVSEHDTCTWICISVVWLCTVMVALHKVPDQTSSLYRSALPACMFTYCLVVLVLPGCSCTACLFMHCLLAYALPSCSCTACLFMYWYALLACSYTACAGLRLGLVAAALCRTGANWPSLCARWSASAWSATRGTATGLAARRTAAPASCSSADGDPTGGGAGCCCCCQCAGGDDHELLVQMPAWFHGLLCACGCC